MTTFALAHIIHSTINDELIEYLHRIDATLEPHGGRFRIHGGSIQRLEGAWTGDLVLIEFPDKASARKWYDSEAYKQIAALRTANSSADVIFIDGVAHDHKATDILTPDETQHDKVREPVPAAGIESGTVWVRETVA